MYMTEYIRLVRKLPEYAKLLNKSKQGKKKKKKKKIS